MNIHAQPSVTLTFAGAGAWTGQGSVRSARVAWRAGFIQWRNPSKRALARGLLAGCISIIEMGERARHFDECCREPSGSAAKGSSPPGQGPKLSRGTMLPCIGDLKGHAIFLDLDGTIAEIAEHPDDVCVQPATLRLLETLSDESNGALAVISGRELSAIDRLLHPLKLPAAGVHGLERRDAAGRSARRRSPWSFTRSALSSRRRWATRRASSSKGSAEPSLCITVYGPISNGVAARSSRRSWDSGATFV